MTHENYRSPEGCVYFVQCGEDGPIKIGHTTGDIERRTARWAAGTPYPPVILGWIQGGIILESQLHERFALHRTHGEWFAAVPELLEFIAQNAALPVEAVPPPEPPPPPAAEEPRPPSLPQCGTVRSVQDLPPAGPEALAAWRRAFLIALEIGERYGPTPTAQPAERGAEGGR